MKLKIKLEKKKKKEEMKKKNIQKELNYYLKKKELIH